MTAEPTPQQHELLLRLFSNDEGAVEPLLLTPKLLEFSLEHRLLPHFIAPLSDGRISLGTEVGDHEITEALGAILSTQLRVEMALVAIADVLDDAGVDFRVLKGLATAHLDYANPALRSFGDVDLLINDPDVDTVVRVLTESQLGSFLPVRGGDGQVQHAITFVLNGVEIDIHRRLLHQAAGHLAARLDLFADPDFFVVENRRLAALRRPLRLLQASGQNVLSAPDDRKYTSDIDVFVLQDAAGEALAEAGDVGLAWVVQEGLRRSMRVLRWTQPEDTAADGVRDRMFERVYGSGDPAPLPAALLELTCAPPSLGVKIVRSVLFPGEEYLRRRGRSPIGQLRRQLGRLDLRRYR